jgi:hypothetical protein
MFDFLKLRSLEIFSRQLLTIQSPILPGLHFLIFIRIFLQQTVSRLKKLLPISSLLFFLFFSCSKTGAPDDPGGTGTIPDTTHITSPVVSMDSVYNYNDLRIFTVSGTTWSCYRLDTLNGLPFIGSSGNGYSGNWQKKLVIDTVRTSKYYTYCTDSSFETFTVKGTTTIGNLKNYFFRSSSSGIVNYYNTIFAFLIQDSVHTFAYDTSKCTMISVYNPTRNTTDTVFVFLSRSYFAMMAPVTFITPYPTPGPPPNPIAPGYYTVDNSLPNFGVQLSSFKHKGSFVLRDRNYPSDLSFSTSLRNASSSGAVFSSEDLDFASSVTKGLLLSKSTSAAGSPLGGHVARTLRINTQN